MNTMRLAADTVSRGLPTLLAAAVAPFVLGIVGMHALNAHGVMSNTDRSTMAGPLTAPMAGEHGDTSTGPVTSPTVGAHAGMPAGPGSVDGHSLGSMVMLCLTMLAATAGALLLVLLGLRRRPRAWAHRLTAPTTVTRWVAARLGAGPLSVWQFSVIRC